MGTVSVSIGGIGHSDKWDPITTGGLGDCLCIVAYDKKKKVGTMYHAVTLDCRTGPSDNIQIVPAEIKKFKKTIDAAFKKVHAKDAKISEYQLKLGNEWSKHTDLKGKPCKAFVAECKKVFKASPVGSALTAKFNCDKGTLS